MSGFNYSKWDNIELSDDESDLHPNIDKESWFRMKHRSRLEREEREDEEIKQLNKLSEQDNSRILIIKARLGKLGSGQADEDAEFEDVEALQGELTELEENIKNRKKIIDGYMNKRSWNIDNICHVKDEKTIVNKANAVSLKAEDFEPTGLTEKVLAAKAESKANSTNETKAEKPVSEISTPVQAPSNTTKPVVSSTVSTVKQLPENPKPKKQDALSYNDYVLAQEDILETYSVIPTMEESKAYLFKHCDILLHEHSQSYLLLSCLEDEMNKKHKRMKLVCRQSQILSHITELAQSMKRDPRDVVLPFFLRLEEKQHLQSFQTAVDDFIVRIQQRAITKRKEMDEEDRNERLSKGVLDPHDVLMMLPESMRVAFENQDVQALHAAVAAMDPVEARKYMKLCVDSGLWVPTNANEFNDNENQQDEDADDNDDEPSDEK